MTLSIRSTRSLRRLIVASTLALACLAPIAPAHAQFGGRAGFDDAFRPDFLARDVVLFVETLGLEDWQRPIVENLLDDYKIAFEAGVEDVRVRMNSIKDDIAKANPDQVLKQIMAPIDDWSKKKIVLRGEFLDNVKSQLSEQQQERWNKLDRALRREKTLEQGEIQGESVDLLLVIKELQLSPQMNEELLVPIEEFEIRLDESLVNRTRRMEAQKQKVQDAMQANDPQAGLAAMEAIMEARVAVRTAQDAGRDSLNDMIRRAAGQESAAEFQRLALERAYPKVYRADPILPLFESVLSITALTDEQKSALTSLEAQYKVEIIDVNKKLADAFRREEPKEPRRRVEMMQARQGADPAVARTARAPEPESLSLARKEREDFYDRYRKAIMDLLTEDQRKEMPTFGKGRSDIPSPRREAGATNAVDPRRNAPGGARAPLMASPPRGGQSKDKSARDDRPDRLKSSPASPGRGSPPAGGAPGGARSVD
ncbi:MAG: hypothetical protein SGJ09_08750 [Phycisphaerae bacterium]|nr:hypothetical protein [Phycisphaerae bacterium]